MPGMYLRPFNCTHCGQTFTMMEGDMILPLPRLCDACLQTYWTETEEALDALGMNADNIQLLQSLKTSQTLTELLAQRARDRAQNQTP